MGKVKYDKVVAIDGPSGSGKSTLAQVVAKELNYLYIDTGSMFRSLGVVLEKQYSNLSVDKINSIAKKELESFLSQLDFKYGEAGKLVVINGVDLSETIRQHEVSKLASIVSQNDLVRNYLKQIQRDLVSNNSCVMEGRDIGTVVFPNAFCKIFLTASAEVRANRRLAQLQSMGKAEGLSFDQVLADIHNRDHADINRPIAPLKKADDAVELDSSSLTEKEVVERIVEISQNRLEELNLNNESNS